MSRALRAEGMERGGGRRRKVGRGKREGVGVGGKGGGAGSLSWEEKGSWALCSHCFNQTGAASSWSGQLGLEQCERAPEKGGAAAE